MANVTENDIKELNKKFDKLTEMVTQLTIGQARLEGELKGEIKTLNESVKGIDKRLDNQDKAIQKIPDLAERIGELKNWRSLALVVISGLVTSLFWFFRNSQL